MLAEDMLAEIAQDQQLSVRYLQLIWDALQAQPKRGGPWDELHSQWRALTSQLDAEGDGVTPATPSQVRAACEQMRDYVLEVRKQFEPHFDNLNARGIHKGSQPFVLWKNKQYAAHRRTADLSRLAPDAFDGQSRDELEVACDSFCAVFPDAFYILERGRDYLDTPKEKQEKGRLLSAGFHSMMGYFRDDRPLMELILDEAGQQELDQLWQELEFFASTPQRQYQGFLWFERTDSNTMRDAEFDFARPEDKDALTEPYVQKLAEVYLSKAQELGAGSTEVSAIEDFFRDINQQIRRVEKTREQAEGAQLKSVVEFASRAFRRPLTAPQAAELASFYQQLRQREQLTHEEALQDCLVSVLLSPRFCYRLDLRSEEEHPQPLDDYELASRLSFFLWASTPDEELLQLAARGGLHRPEVLRSQTQRMLQDPRIRGLAVEFAANWLDFRQFEQHNSVDRERFPRFDDDLRSAMFEEPIQFFLDVVRHDRSILDFIYAERTFVNRSLAEHYGLGDLTFSEEWQEVPRADHVGRGGLLPMAVFLTQNAPGLRTSPVKRGYWVVRRLLGERIPPPPPDVPDLPADESLLGTLTLRQTLAKHRDHESCASCHNRIDSIGLVFENYGPIGELRSVDLGGQPVDTSGQFPDGSQRASVSDLRDYIREVREEDFISNLHRKLLSYGLSRSLQLSDEPLLQHLQDASAANHHSFQSLVQEIVASPQFLNKRGYSGPPADLVSLEDTHE